MITFRRAEYSDFPEIIALQKYNLLRNLNPEDQQEGFLTIEYPLDQMESINDQLGIFIAVKNGSLSGFLMAQTLNFALQSPLVNTMVMRFPNVLYRSRPLSEYRTFIYGPVCIDKQSRGQGILEGLFNLMLRTLRQYDVGVAFVSERNPRSFQAHQVKLGMTVVDEFQFNGQKYFTLVFAVAPKV